MKKEEKIRRQFRVQAGRLARITARSVVGGEKIAKLGKPSLVFGPGQERRIALVKKYFDLKGKRILDAGCGIGLYSQKFKELGAEVFGTDIDWEKIKTAKNLNPGINFGVGALENLPFPDNFFDIVFVNEVLEHVKDDKKAAKEILRVLKQGGSAIIFAPNILYPFETHGIFLFNRYLHKNVPFINWLPKIIRDYFCPHVKVYSAKTLRKLFQGLPASFVLLSYVFPAFDRLSKKIPVFAGILRGFARFAEKNPLLKKFGLSLFAIVKKQ